MDLLDLCRCRLAKMCYVGINTLSHVTISDFTWELIAHNLALFEVCSPSRKSQSTTATRSSAIVPTNQSTMVRKGSILIVAAAVASCHGFTRVPPRVVSTKYATRTSVELEASTSRPLWYIHINLMLKLKTTQTPLLPRREEDSFIHDY